jgi:hypothetical protein
MKDRLWQVSAAIFALALISACALPCGAQAPEIKEKPPMYSYIANWQIPRTQWADMEKAAGADKAILDKALADGTIVGYGHDETIVHQLDGETHDDWWASMSMAGLLKVLDEISAAGNSTTPVLASATKHWDEVVVSRYYNWKPGAWKGGYVHIGEYTLKAGAPDDAIDTVAKRIVGPLLEKLLAEGAISEYEVDVAAIHTESQDKFWVVYVTPTADGLDKVNAAIAATLQAQPMLGSALEAMTDGSAHRDGLSKGGGVFK